MKIVKPAMSRQFDLPLRKARSKSLLRIGVFLSISCLAGVCSLCLLGSWWAETREPVLNSPLSRLEQALPTGTSMLSPALSMAAPPTFTLTPFSPLSATETPDWVAIASPTITASPTPALAAGAACLPMHSERQAATLLRVIDGDTIEVELENGSVYRVRYLGINTPSNGERLFAEASAANADLLEGKSILLVRDVSNVDRYDRLLRYVLAGDIFVNYELVRLGLAEPGSYPPDVACDETFFNTAQAAREAELGIWAVVGPLPSEITPPERSQSNCDPSYPTVCIPPYPPDLDCKDIPYRRFQVNPPDPHFFDGDYDGMGCEGG